eukprot:356556-Chlamydomonas_euryale.AAC.1
MDHRVQIQRTDLALRTGCHIRRGSYGQLCLPLPYQRWYGNDKALVLTIRAVSDMPASHMNCRTKRAFFRTILANGL